MFKRLFGKSKDSGGGGGAPPPHGKTDALSSIEKLNETLEMLEKREALLHKKMAQEIQKAKEYTRQKNKRGACVACVAACGARASSPLSPSSIRPLPCAPNADARPRCSAPAPCPLPPHPAIPPPPRNAAALQCLKRKKMYEAQADQLANQQLRIHDQKIMLEGAKATTETVAAMRTGAQAMKKLQKETNIEDVDKTLDDIMDQTENMRQINEALGQPIGIAAEIDEDDLDAELQELEAEELDRQLMEPAVPPSIERHQAQAQQQASRPAPLPQESLPAVPTGKIQSKEDDELAALEAELAL